MASTIPPTPPDKERKLTQINKDPQSKRHKDEPPDCAPQVVHKAALPGAYFVPYIRGTLRILSPSIPGFLAAKDHIEDLIGHSFTDPRVLLEAMYPLKNEWARIGARLILREANYRLALVGDAVLKLAILDARFDIMELNGTHKHDESPDVFADKTQEPQISKFRAWSPTKISLASPTRRVSQRISLGGIREVVHHLRRPRQLRWRLSLVPSGSTQKRIFGSLRRCWKHCWGRIWTMVSSFDFVAQRRLVKTEPR